MRKMRIDPDLGALPSPTLGEMLTFAQVWGGEKTYKKSISCRNKEAGGQGLCLSRDTGRCAPHHGITPHLIPHLIPPVRGDHQHRETPDGSDAAQHELPARSEITHRGLPRRGKLHSHQTLLICVI